MECKVTQFVPSVISSQKPSIIFCLLVSLAAKFGSSTLANMVGNTFCRGQTMCSQNSGSTGGQSKKEGLRLPLCARGQMHLATSE
jgi:hypothetical protein